MDAIKLNPVKWPARGADVWRTGCGGTEEPFEYHGTRWLYVFNPAREQHGYLNLDTDVVHADYRQGD